MNCKNNLSICYKSLILHVFTIQFIFGMTLQSVKDGLYFNQEGDKAMNAILEQIEQTADAIGIMGVLFILGLGALLTVIMVLF